MTQYILTGDEMRTAEAAADCSLSELMERAGAAVAEAVWRYGGGRPTLILCGPGNNGGDGYVAARLLKARGLDVRVAALREPRSELGIAARALWNGPVETLAGAEPAPVLVDALFGTGLKRALEDETVSALARLAGAAHFTMAVDLPSGVGTDDGAALGAIPVDLTLALGSLKPANLLHPAAGLCGAVRVADIGINCMSTVSVIERPRLAEPDTERRHSWIIFDLENRPFCLIQFFELTLSVWCIGYHRAELEHFEPPFVEADTILHEKYRPGGR